MASLQTSHFIDCQLLGHFLAGHYLHRSHRKLQTLQKRCLRRNYWQGPKHWVRFLDGNYSEGSQKGVQSCGGPHCLRRENYGRILFRSRRSLEVYLWSLELDVGIIFSNFYKYSYQFSFFFLIVKNDFNHKKFDLTWIHI